MIKTLTILFLLFDLTLHGESFFGDFFSLKKEPEQTQRPPKFSSIDYKSIVLFLKEYHPKYKDVAKETKKLNETLYTLHYLDRGAVQVFHAQNLLYDFQEIQHESCIIKNRLYTDWLLNQDGFFIKLTKKIASLKTKYKSIQNAKELFADITFAQKNIIPELTASVQSIINTFEESEQKKLGEEEDVLKDTAIASQENIRKIEQEIANKNIKITNLKNKIKDIEKDSQAWQEDLLQFNEQVKATDEFAEKFTKLREEYDNNIKNITDQLNKIEEQIEQEESDIKKFETRLLNSTEINLIIENINNYNIKKQTNLVELENKNFFERTQNFFKPESEELITLRTNIVNKITKLDEYDQLNAIPMFNEQKIFTQKFIEQLTFFSNTEILNSEMQSANNHIFELQNKETALKNQKKNFEDIFKKAQISLNTELAKFERPFQHENILLRGSTESTTIADSLKANEAKINLLNKEIQEIEKNIKQKREDIDRYKNVIELAKAQTPKNREESYKLSQENMIKALKELDVSSFAQKYVTQLLNKKQSNITLTQKSALKNNDMAESLLYAIQVARFNLTRILAIPIYQPELSVKSLAGAYQEMLSPQEILSHKAMELKQGASEKVAAITAAFAQKKNQFFGGKTKPTVTKKATEKINQDSNIYCKADVDMTENIKAKMTAILDDIEDMIRHTLLLAKTISTDYRQLVALKDLFFLPLCNEYEQFKKIVAPWGIMDTYFRPEDLKNEYAHLITIQQDQEELIITEESTNLIATNFFAAVIEGFTQHINKLSLQKEKNDENWFQKKYKALYQIQNALHICMSTQLRWYQPSKNRVEQLNTLKKLIIEKKVIILNELLPSSDELEKSITANANDILIKDNHIHGKLITTIEKIHDIKQSLLAGLFLFSTSYKKQKSKQNIPLTIQKVQTKLENIAKYAQEQFTNTNNSLYQQTVKPLYQEIKNYAEQLLLNIPPN